MAVPLFRGKPYTTSFTVSPAILPNENDTLTFNIGKKYSFTPGNSVIISGTLATSSRFEAIVDVYDPLTGDMTVTEITNIKNFTTAIAPLTITLTGERGSKILANSGAPSNTNGRSGDMYIDTATGEVYIKS